MGGGLTEKKGVSEGPRKDRAIKTALIFGAVIVLSLVGVSAQRPASSVTEYGTLHRVTTSHNAITLLQDYANVPALPGDGSPGSLLNEVEPDSGVSWQTLSELDWFWLDRRAPEVTMDSIPEFVTSLTLVSGTANDERPGKLDRVEICVEDDSQGIYWNGTTWIPVETWIAAKGTRNWECAVLCSLDGHSYNIAARAIDRTGNQSPTVSRPFMVDASRPTVVLNSIPEFLNAFPSISGTAADVNPGSLDRVLVKLVDEDSKLYWNGRTWVEEDAWLAPEGLESWLISAPSLTNGHLYAVSARARDKAGNESVAFDSFIFDNDKPSVALNNIGDTVNDLRQITGTSKDTSPGQVQKVQVETRDLNADLYWDGTSWVSGPTWIDATGTTSWRVRLANLLDGGKYEVRVRSFDQAGNVSETVRSAFTYNAVQPVVQPTAPVEPDASVQPAITLDKIDDFATQVTEISGTTAASADDVRLVCIRILDSTGDLYWDGEIWLAEPVWIEIAETGSWSYLLPPQLDGHFYQIEAKCVGLDRNESDVVSTGFYCDSSPPVLGNINAVSEGVEGAYIIKGTASDAEPGEVVGVRLLVRNDVDGTYWNGDSWMAEKAWVEATGTSAWSYSLPALSHGQAFEIEARCFDRAGNVSLAEILTFSPDKPSGGLIWLVVGGLGYVALLAFALLLGWRWIK